MRDSVITNDYDHCFVCGSCPVARHHIFYGSANRKLADEDGYWIPLCPYHHNGSNTAVHFNRDFDTGLKQAAQEHYELAHTRQDFIRRYGKSYL